MKGNSLNSCQKAIALLLSIVLFSMPTLLIAQQSEMDQARIEAERDARRDTNGALWFFAGCCGGPTGLVVSYAITPSPPVSKFLGKSPEYVAYYTDFYRAKAKSIQTGRALMGCGVTVAVYVAFYIRLLQVAPL